MEKIMSPSLDPTVAEKPLLCERMNGEIAFSIYSPLAGQRINYGTAQINGPNGLKVPNLVSAWYSIPTREEIKLLLDRSNGNTTISEGLVFLPSTVTPPSEVDCIVKIKSGSSNRVQIGMAYFSQRLNRWFYSGSTISVLDPVIAWVTVSVGAIPKTQGF